MRAIDASLVAIDFEGTGAVAGYRNEPWQIGVVEVSGGHPRPDAEFTSLLRIDDRPFNPHAPGRHAELRDAMRVAPRLPDLWPRVRRWVADRPDALIAHNCGTEKRFLADAFPLASCGPWIDTLKLSRMAFPDLASHRLEDVIAHIDRADRLQALSPDATYHDARFDAMASAVIIEYLLELDTWREVSVSALTSARPVRYHRRRRRPSRH